MTGIDQEWGEVRQDVAARNRRYAIESRLHKVTLLVAGLMAYSAFGNFVATAMVLHTSPIDAGVGVVFGVLYTLGLYRVWLKDDIRWWPVAVPAGLTIVWLLLVWWAAGLFAPIPIVLNIVLLALVPFRARTCRELTALSRGA